MKNELEEIEKSVKATHNTLNTLSFKYEILGLGNMTEPDKILLAETIQQIQLNTVRLCLVKDMIEHDEEHFA